MVALFLFVVLHALCLSLHNNNISRFYLTLLWIYDILLLYSNTVPEQRFCNCYMLQVWQVIRFGSVYCYHHITSTIKPNYCVFASFVAVEWFKLSRFYWSPRSIFAHRPKWETTWLCQYFILLVGAFFWTNKNNIIMLAFVITFYFERNFKKFVCTNCILSKI